MQNWIRGSVVLPLVGFCVAGIVGNRADALFLQTLPVLTSPISVSLWVAILAISVSAIPSALTARRYYRAHNASSGINELDDILLLQLTRLKNSTNPSQEFNRLVESFLDKTIDLFFTDHGCGITVYSPSRQEPDCLTTWLQIEMPNDSRNSVRFYIGNDPTRERDQGVAGYTFLKRELQVVHIWKKNGVRQADNERYVVYSNNRRLTYRSFITLPVLKNPNESMCVLCLYSSKPNVFDSIAIQELLSAISSRLSAAILIAESYNIQIGH